MVFIGFELVSYIRYNLPARNKELCVQTIFVTLRDASGNIGGTMKCFRKVSPFIEENTESAEIRDISEMVLFFFGIGMIFILH